LIRIWGVAGNNKVFSFVVVHNGNYELTIWFYDEVQFMKDIKYVHELQNALNVCKVTEGIDIVV
jgi:hypothetical protein